MHTCRHHVHVHLKRILVKRCVVSTTFTHIIILLHRVTHIQMFMYIVHMYMYMYVNYMMECLGNVLVCQENMLGLICIYLLLPIIF